MLSSLVSLFLLILSSLCVCLYNVAAKPESAELHAIKNDYGSVEGGDEVWIRGSKMIGNRESHDQLYNSLLVTTSPLTASVYFEIRDQSTNRCIRQFPGDVMKEECHQVGLNYNITMYSIYDIITVESSCCEDTQSSI